MEYETHQAGEANGLGTARSYSIFDEFHQSACYPSIPDNTVSASGAPSWWEGTSHLLGAMGQPSEGRHEINTLAKATPGFRVCFSLGSPSSFAVLSSSSSLLLYPYFSSLLLLLPRFIHSFNTYPWVNARVVPGILLVTNKEWFTNHLSSLPS